MMEMRFGPSIAAGDKRGFELVFADINPLNRFGFYKALRDPAWYLSSRGRESRRRLAAYRDRHAGEQAVIIGSGPSLRHTDLSRLTGRTVFGMNRLYTGFDTLGLTVDYHLAINDYVLHYYGAELVGLGIPLFSAWSGRADVPYHSHVTDLYTLSDHDFEYDLTKRVPAGATVTYAAIQLAYYMGFTDVVLVGVDHRFILNSEEEASGPNAAIVRSGDDPNHFSSTYFPEGVIWQTPDFARSEPAYRNALAAYSADGRVIRDATVDGALTIFPRYPEDLRLPETGAAQSGGE
tara:strand:- start:26005 stop:26880 length:876 start_codon:yes stop_codon:yes gene_type:complete